MTNPPAQQTPRLARRSAARERGSLLVWAAIVSLMVLGVITAGVGSDAAQDTRARMAAAVGGQARSVALAGLVDAYAWFRRQQTQPVTNFAPVRNLAAIPPINETDDQAIGLVREYEILPSLWGRYEVRRTVPAEAFVDGNGNGRHDAGEAFTDTDGNGKWDNTRETRDVTGQRGLAGAGAVWLIESRGFLYDRPRADLPLGTAPNNLRASLRVASEIRRMTITPPAAAALCAAAGSSVTIGSRGRLRGGLGAGLAYGSSTGIPVLQAGAEVTGVPPTTSVPNYAGALTSVFSVSAAELKSMADVSTSTMASVPSPVGSYTLTVIDGNATFTAAQPLRGTGVMVVLGNCTISAGSNSYFSGLLWVQGTLTVRAPSYLRGVTIVEGSADVRGTGGDLAELEYDTGVLNDLLFLMGQYRHSKAVYVPGIDPGALAAGGP
jgi:hypothetical protein